MDKQLKADRLTRRVERLANYTGTVSLESAEIMNAHRDLKMTNLVKSDSLKKAIDSFNVSSLNYRKNPGTTFVEHVKSIEAVLNNPTTFTDTVKWYDNEDELKKMRLPVSVAYLRMFGESDSNRVVVDDEFWKCIDLKDLRGKLHTCNRFKHVATIFTRPDSFDKITTLLKLISGLRLECLKLSTTFEDIFNKRIASINSNTTLTLNNLTDFDKSQTVVSGVSVTASIADTAHAAWYGKSLNTSIGSMASNLATILDDVREYCSGEHSDNAMSVSHLFAMVKHKDVSENLRLIHAEFLNLADQLTISRRGLDIICDQIVDANVNMTTPTSTTVDLLQLLDVYSSTLVTIATFLNDASSLLLSCYDEVENLYDEVKNLKVAIEDYIKVRLKNER